MRPFSLPVPSPAMIVALIALFVALGGVGYSAVTGAIDSREIKDRTIRSRDVRNNTLKGVDVRNSALTGGDVRKDSLRGADVLESSLDTVPSATSAGRAATAGLADRAQTAGSADAAQSINGLRVVAVKHRSGDVTNQTVFDAGGLQLVVSCGAGDEELRARSTVAGGEIAAISDDPVAGDGAPTSLVHNLDDNFGPGEEFDLQDTAGASDDRVYTVHYLGGDGTDITLHLITDDDLGSSNCIVSGYAVIG